MGILPNSEELKKVSPLQLAWLFYWLQKVEDDWFNRWEEILGTSWSREDLIQMERKNSTRPPKVRIPILSGLAQFDLKKELRKTFGVGAPDMPGVAPTELQGTEIEELGYLSKEEFLAIIGGAGLLPKRPKDR